MRPDAVTIAILALLIAVGYGWFSYWRAARKMRNRSDEMRRHIEEQRRRFADVDGADPIDRWRDGRIKDME